MSFIGARKGPHKGNFLHDEYLFRLHFHFYFLNAGKSGNGQILLFCSECFKMGFNGLFQIRHELVKRLAVGVAALERRDSTDKNAVLVSFDHGDVAR
jgi:hypothetical protein